MRPRFFVAIFSLAVFSLAFLAVAPLARAETIVFTTEEYPPYTFREGKEYRGIGIEQIEAVMKDAGIPYSIEMMPWARAYALAQSEPMHCVFATAHNAERDALFKWVEPMLVDRNLLISRRSSGVKPTSMDDAKRYIVGTHRDDYTQKLLEERGFPKIDIATDFNLTLKKLLSGRIDLMPISEKFYDKLRKQGVEVESVMVFSEQKFGMACHKDVPTPLIERMQAALDALIADGRQDAIYRKYGLEPIP